MRMCCCSCSNTPSRGRRGSNATSAVVAMTLSVQLYKYTGLTWQQLSGLVPMLLGLAVLGPASFFYSIPQSVFYFIPQSVFYFIPQSVFYFIPQSVAQVAAGMATQTVGVSLEVMPPPLLTCNIILDVRALP